jgi:hypothetical protein
VIALCISNNINLNECVGFGTYLFYLFFLQHCKLFLFLGVVRNINKSTGDIFVITPVAPNLLKYVNQFNLGNINLPYTFYTKGTQISKFVSVKQDNIFNEDVTRHYKVMS